MENSKYKVYIEKSPKPDKKYKCIVVNKENNKKKTIHFGSSQHSDYTIHQQHKRMLRYIFRHGAKNFSEKAQQVFNTKDFKDIPEDMTYEQAKKFNHLFFSSKEKWDDVFTAGFWSRWYLWSHIELKDCEQFISKHFNIEFC